MLILTPTNYTELFSAFNLQACCWMNPEEEEVKRENPIYRVITNIELLTRKQNYTFLTVNEEVLLIFSQESEQNFAIFQGI